MAAGEALSPCAPARHLLDICNRQGSMLSEEYPISFHEHFQVQVDTVWFQLARGLISCCANLQAVKLLFNIWPNMNILNLYLFNFFNQSYYLTFSSSKLNKLKTSERGLNFKNSYII